MECPIYWSLDCIWGHTLINGIIWPLLLPNSSFFPRTFHPVAFMMLVSTSTLSSWLPDWHTGLPSSEPEFLWALAEKILPRRVYLNKDGHLLIIADFSPRWPALFVPIKQSLHLSTADLLLFIADSSAQVPRNTTGPQFKYYLKWTDRVFKELSKFSLKLHVPSLHHLIFP